MLSNPERHFLPSHWDWTKKPSHDPPIIPKTLHPNTFSNTEPTQKTKQTIHNFNMQFSTFGIFRNLPLRTSSKLNFMGDQIPLLRQTHQQGNPQGELESSLETARFPRRYAGHFEVSSGTHWQGGEVTFKWIYAVLTCSPLKIGIVGRQSCSLFGGGVAFFSGANLLF